MMTVGSLFSGVGGFDLGFEQAGYTVAWQDVLVGGFPCQDLSVAGKREGLTGARSGLFYELMRIARELRPEWVVLENVPGLLTSHGGRDVHAVLAEMADSGFHDRAYRVLDSRYFGVAQRRRRVFLVGCAGTEFGRAGAVLLESSSSGGDSAAGRAAGAGAARGVAGGTDGPVAFDWQSGGDCWLNVNDKTSELTGHQTPAVYQCHGTNVGPMGTLRQGSGNVQSGVPFVAATLKQRGRGYTDEVMDNLQVASSLSASMGHHGHSSPRGDGSDNLVAATLGQRMRGQDDSCANNLQVAATLNSGGNSGGFRTEPGEHLVPDLAPCLETTAGDYSRADGFVSIPVQAGVRRLTPLETERLQGFPDMWTCLCGATTTASCTCPDSPRYKQMGNAVTVPVIRWIAERLAMVARKERVA